MLKNSCNLCIRLWQSYRQHMLWLKPDSSHNYSSSKHLCFSCMLDIMKYSNKLNMSLLSLGNSHYYNRCTLKHHCIANIMLKLLNMLCRQQKMPNSNPQHMLNMHLKFSCSYCNLQYQSKQGMTWNLPNSNHYCKQYMHSKFSCTLNIKNLDLNTISSLQNLRDNSLIYKLCRQKRLRSSNKNLIQLYIK